MPIPGLVSVIVPAYGHAKFIRSALDSVVAQTYKDIELIVLDDRSPDNTFELVKRYAESIPKGRFRRCITKINAENMGAHATINKGIALSQGEYVTVLNSDDQYSPKRLEVLIAGAKKTGSQLLFSGIKTIDEKGKRLFKPGLASEVEALVDYASVFPSLSFALLFKNIAVSTGNMLFTRVLFDRLGGFHALRYCHDWDFALRATLVTEPVLVPEPMYLYRIHGDNTSSKLIIEQYLEPLAVIRRFLSAARSSTIENPLAPTSYNWPGMYDMLLDSSDNVRGAMHIVGGGQIRGDAVLRYLP